jgi:hypothetical protein
LPDGYADHHHDHGNNNIIINNVSNDFGPKSSFGG